jgi:hypothetical protein
MSIPNLADLHKGASVIPPDAVTLLRRQLTSQDQVLRAVAVDAVLAALSTPAASPEARLLKLQREARRMDFVRVQTARQQQVRKNRERRRSTRRVG